MKLMMLDVCLLLTISMMAQSPSTPTPTATTFQFTERAHSNSDLASAFANGSVLGVPVSNGFSHTGVNRDTTITITSNH